MRILPLLALILTLCIAPAVVAIVLNVPYDNFGTDVRCGGNTFNCGTTSDFIGDQGTSYSVNLTDDHLATYVCATYLNEAGSAFTQSCIVRSPFNYTICDAAISAVTPTFNKSGFYNCTSANLSACGWNGNNGIPQLGVPAPATGWQRDTNIVNASEFIFISYYCNVTPQVASQSGSVFLRVDDTKSLACIGDGYAGVVYDRTGSTTLGTPLSCGGQGSFCDASSQNNISMTTNFTTTSICTPGCYDSVQNGNETDIDYGGSICGNCTPDGKSRDAYYGFARSADESNTTILSRSNPFSASYCATGEQVGTASFTGLFIVLLYGGIILLLLLALLVGLGGIIIVLILGRFLKKKRKRV